MGLTFIAHEDTSLRREIQSEAAFHEIQ